jgi:endonuclease YncB( thermonuclease family)
MIIAMIVIAATLAALNYNILFQRGYLVTRVIDGDTIEVAMNGKREIVRYILIDAPEMGTKAGERAKEANRRLVEARQSRPGSLWSALALCLCWANVRQSGLASSGARSDSSRSAQCGNA